MPYTLTKRYGFTASHHLPSLPADHASSRPHEHDFRVELVIEGEMSANGCFVVDYGDIDAAFLPVKNEMEGGDLNTIDGLANPSAENLARYVYERLKPELPLMVEVRVSESADDCAAYRPA